jgi:hypothetical protein
VSAPVDRRARSAPAPTPVARGPGPRWVRIALAALAVLYFAGLVKSPPRRPGLSAVTFFTEATCLFPSASRYAIELRLEVWSCDLGEWRPLDPSPYFPIEAGSKESRFQRIGYFYQRNRVVLSALDEWLVARHDAARDGVAGPIGGIRLIKVLRPIPAPGDAVERYVYRPLEPAPAEQRREIYWTKPSARRARCAGAP